MTLKLEFLALLAFDSALVAWLRFSVSVDSTSSQNPQLCWEVCVGVWVVVVGL